MIRNWEAFAVQSRERERVWTVEDLPVLRAASCLPEPEQEGRIRRFYRIQERAFYRFCERDLLAWAEAAGKADLASGRLPVCREAELTWRETYRAGRLWSLCTLVRENAAPGPSGTPSAAQWGDVWDLGTGFPVPASDCFPPKYPWKRRFFEAAEAEMERRERAGLCRYYPGWRRGLRRYFSARRYYLTEEGVVFFYPLYALAPPSEGLPSFTLPWEDIGGNRKGELWN